MQLLIPSPVTASSQIDGKLLMMPHYSLCESLCVYVCVSLVSLAREKAAPLDHSESSHIRRSRLRIATPPLCYCWELITLLSAPSGLPPSDAPAVTSLQYCFSSFVLTQRLLTRKGWQSREEEDRKNEAHQCWKAPELEDFRSFSPLCQQLASSWS